jgi:hypothetical protein
VAVLAPALPVLSSVAAWDTEYLAAAARQWDSKAASWEDGFTEVFQQTPTPGGTPWSGAAADAALVRAHSDRVKVLAVVDQLHSAAVTARSGAVELAAARQRVLAAVSDAHAAGFAVGEDYSVAYARRVSSAAEATARRVQEQSLSNLIRSRASELATLDHDVAERISASAMDVGKIGFKEHPPGADALSVKDAKDVHKIVDPLPPGKNQDVKTLPTPDAIRRLYEQLTENAGPAPTSAYPGERRMLRDGTIIGYRPDSDWGGPTTEIRYPDGTKTDVHLPERPNRPQPAPVPAPVPVLPPAPLPVPAPNPVAAPPVSGSPPFSSPAPPVSPEEAGVLATIGAGVLWVIAGIGGAVEAALGG